MATVETPNGQTDGADKQKQRIGDTLIAHGLITPDQLEVALHEKKRSNKMLGDVLAELGFISEDTLTAVLAERAGAETFDPRTALIDPEVVSIVPKEVAIEHHLLPLSMTDGTFTVAMADPYDIVALDLLRRYIPRNTRVVPQVCSSADLVEAIDRSYGYEMSIDGILREIDTGEIDVSSLSMDAGYTHPVVRLVDALLLDAIKLGASDIHFEPEEHYLRLRYRIDGVMTQIRTFHQDHWPFLSQRLKIMSDINIADKLNPQDGRFAFHIGGHEIDFRVSTWPVVDGENIVLRVLDKSRALLSLEDLGFNERNLDLLNRLLQRPEGIVIVTGPTGSGKSTTIYAILSHISTIERNIMTLEDPVEYDVPLIRQAQIREGTGVSFEAGERALLRQDPDIWFIGEIRDVSTARMALRAATTGHQVYTTLHANDSLGAIPRLIDLGLKPELMAGNIIAIQAQRLMRKLCTKCKKDRPASASECQILGVDPESPPPIWEPVGCSECRETGYKGRTAVVEILPVDEEIDELIATQSTRAKLKAGAEKKGFVPMIDDGIEKVLAGLASFEDLRRVVDLTARL